MKDLTPEGQKKVLEQTLKEMKEIREERTGKYHDLLHDLGLKGRFTSLYRKYSRLREMVWREDFDNFDNPEDLIKHLEKIKEEGKDLGNYTLIFLVEVANIMQKVKFLIDNNSDLEVDDIDV